MRNIGTGNEVHCVSRVVGTLLVLCQDNESPSDDEWNDVLQKLATIRATGEGGKVLVITQGGGPNVQQRKRLEQTLGGLSVPVAVVSDSLKLRFISAAVTLFNSSHRAFSRSELQDAYKHLHLASHEIRRAEVAVKELLAALQGAGDTEAKR